MHRPLATRLATVLLSIGAGLLVACTQDTKIVPMATTTTIEGSGLLSVLLPAVKTDLGLDVHAIAVASGRALDILDRGDADVGFTHDPDNELRFLEKGTFGDYRKVMYNDFLIAGPAADPAQVKSASSAVDAMNRIAGIDVAFVSRADSSGTNTRELLLWRKAGRKPLGDKYIESGQPMSGTLRIASERQAYLLTDRATFMQMAKSVRLAILYESDPILLNTYAVTYRKGLAGAQLKNARAIFDWLADGKGRDQISSFTVQGQPGFHVWPTDRPRSQPGDLPNGR